MKQKQIIRYLVEILGLAIVYHLAARLGLQMAYVQENTSPVWPPSGIALAALLLFGIRDWPGITLGVAAGSLLIGAPPGLALGLGAANTLETLIATYLLNRIGFSLSLDRIRDVTGLLLASVCGTSVSATIGVLSVILARGIPASAFFTLWIIWLVGNLLGCLVITPLILIWVRQFPRGWNRYRIMESLVYLTFLVMVSQYVFGNPSSAGAFHQALIYAIFPFAIWAALRMEQFGAATTVFIVSGIAIWGTIHELGPFARVPINESLVLLQTFTGIVALISLTLAASASERRKAEANLRKQVNDLAALNDASKLFLENIEKQALYKTICRLAVERFDLSAAWIDRTPFKESRQEPLSCYPDSQDSSKWPEALRSSVPQQPYNSSTSHTVTCALIVLCPRARATDIRW